MKTRICHVTSVHNRYDTRIFQKECRSLAEAGYDVYFLVNDSLESEIIENVHIVSTGFKPQNRRERFTKLNKIMLAHLMEIDASVYHFHDPDLLPLALKLRKRNKTVKIVFDSHEDYPAQIMEKEWIPCFLRRVMSQSFSIYQRIVLRRFDYIISVSPNIVDKLKKANNMVELITNYPIVANVNMGKQDNLAENIEAGRTICFAGGVSEQWCHEVILEAIQNIDVKYILCGPADIGYIERLKEMKAWNKVDYLNIVPFEEVRHVYQLSQVGLAILRYNSNAGGKQGTLGNTKLFEYMQAGLPVICTDFAFWKDIVQKNNCGICVNPYDEMQVRNAIQYLLDNPTEAVNMGNNGKRLIYEKYNWSTQVETLLRIYRDLTEILGENKYESE